MNSFQKKPYNPNIKKINAFQKNSLLIKIRIVCCQNVNNFLIIMSFLYKNQNSKIILY